MPFLLSTPRDCIFFFANSLRIIFLEYLHPTSSLLGRPLGLIHSITVLRFAGTSSCHVQIIGFIGPTRNVFHIRYYVLHIKVLIGHLSISLHLYCACITPQPYRILIVYTVYGLSKLDFRVFFGQGFV